MQDPTSVYGFRTYLQYTSITDHDMSKRNTHLAIIIGAGYVFYDYF